jgi:ferredoxin-type protein NapF
LRPPHALPEADFLARCTRCDDCIRHCPQGILKRGDGGFPQVDFSHAACTFCGACVEACQAGALRGQAGQPPWLAYARIAAACLAQRQIACQLCRDACEARAIRFRYLSPIPTPHIEAQACTGCGACVGVCPAQAISVAPA